MLDAFIESGYRLLVDAKQKASNRKSWYAHKKLDRPTLPDKEPAMNDLKPAARYLSPLAMVIAIGILILLLVRSPNLVNFEFIAIMLALVAIWLQNIVK